MVRRPTHGHLIILCETEKLPEESVNIESWCLCCFLSRVRLFVAPQTVFCQALLPMKFSRQKSLKPLPFPGDLLDPGTEYTSLVSLALAGRFFTTNTTWEALIDSQAVVNGLAGLSRA